MSDQELLNILQAQGQRFLDSFSLPASSTRKRKRDVEVQGTEHRNVGKAAEDDLDDGLEWQGITRKIEHGDGLEDTGGKDGLEDFEQEDDGFTASTTSRIPEVVVFADSSLRPSTTESISKANKKTFMSSKVSKLSQMISDSMEEKNAGENADEERTNVQNDAILHRLVHTKLLSGSLNPELDLTSAQRRKALAGRVLELAGEAKLGKGEKTVRETERNKAAKRVREGILEKKKERERKGVEEAKNLGNYHPTLKKLYEPSASAPGHPKRRERGLKMGVGKFRGGMLKLSRDEINAAQGNGARGVGGLNTRGLGRGRGRGRS